MNIRSAAMHRRSRPAGRLRARSRRWAGMLVPVLAVTAMATTMATVGGISPAAASGPSDSVTVGGDPQGVAVDPDGKHAYVTNFAHNTVSVIDTATHKVTGRLSVGAGPRGLAVAPDSRHLYVTNYVENSVSEVDTASGRVSRSIAVGKNPASVALSTKDPYAFVTNFYENTVSVIDLLTFKVIGTLAVGGRPDGVTVDSKGELAYVVNTASNSVSVIDIREQRVVRTILVGRAPQKVAVDRDNRHAYVTNFGDHSVSVIDLVSELGYEYAHSALKVNNTIPVGINPRGLAVHPDSQRAFVVNVADNNMTVLDTANGTVIGTVYIGFDPDEVAAGPDGVAYVTSRSESTVTIVDPE